MNTVSSINRLHSLLYKNICTIDQTLSYDRIIEALRILGDTLDRYHGDNEDWIYIGEFTIPIDDLIVGSYWHLTEYHAGQYSDTYKALCSLGSVFSPGMESGPDPDTCEYMIYEDLNLMADSMLKQS